jgi:hypothetical protein
MKMRSSHGFSQMKHGLELQFGAVLEGCHALNDAAFRVAFLHFKIRVLSVKIRG